MLCSLVFIVIFFQHTIDYRMRTEEFRMRREAFRMRRAEYNMVNLSYFIYLRGHLMVLKITLFCSFGFNTVFTHF